MEWIRRDRGGTRANPDAGPGSGPWWRHPLTPPPDDSLPRWIVPSALIGVVAGLGAAALFGLLHLCTRWILEYVGGYHPYLTSAEGGFRTLTGSHHPWVVPLVAAGGALLATLLVVWLAPEARGHGTDAAIAAAHHDPSGMRGRVTVVKLMASALTIGSGGSGGTEGPAAQISAAFGSVIARRTGMTRQQARTALVIGLASGVGAIFQAPLGGALLGAELLYRKDMDPKVLPQALIAACTGWLAFGAIFGFAPILGAQGVHGYGFTDFVLVAVVGVAAGLAGRLYAGTFYAVHNRVESRARTVVSRLAAPTCAALLVGALGLAVPGVLGTGYGLMEALTHRQVLLDMPLYLVLLLPFAKIVGTSLTVGSGGSGGIFGPCMVVGAGVGAAVWRLAEPSGLAPHSPLLLVVAGMAACLGPVAHAPLGVLLMAVEMVGDASLLGPGILAVLCASAVIGRTTLYRSQLDHRTDEPSTGTRLPRPGHDRAEPSAPAVPPAAPAPKPSPEPMPAAAPSPAPEPVARSVSPESAAD
ncbi:chloride channel protein [Streptomyces sp. NPDC058695]|uniref:chloride channel protein n=1 Tax=Streptomyces sp. NPDC058695 TaxID=3346604 RepID=UPI003657E88E